MGYDHVYRKYIDIDLKVQTIKIKRARCLKCKKIYRLPNKKVYRNKHYGSDIIDGVLNGYINNQILKYEDHPSEETIARWITEFTHSL